MKLPAKSLVYALVIVALIVGTVGCTSTATPAAPTSAPAAPTTAPAAAATTAPAAAPTTGAAAPAAPRVVDASKLPQMLTFATTPAGTADYTTVTALSKVATDIGPMKVIVQPAAGASAWLPQMTSAGKPEIGVMNVGEAWQAYTGKVAAGPLPEGVDIKSPYTTANPNIRLLFIGPELATGFIVKKDSQFQSVADLKGATITWGLKGQVGAFLVELANLAMADIKKSDVKTVEIANVNDGVRALGEGRVDATSVATTTGIVPEVDSQVALRFIDTPNDPSKLKDAQSVMPGAHIVKVKAGSTVGAINDVNVIGFNKAYIAPITLSDDAAYLLVKTWFENYAKLIPMDKQFATWSAEKFASTSATIPYHPGAIAFYKEKGLWTAEMDKNQELLLKGELPFLK